MSGTGARPALVLLAHGTGDPAGRRTLGALLLRLRSLVPGVQVRLAYAGVARPRLADLLTGPAALAGPVVVVPAFLAAGFHVRVDVPAQLEGIGRDDVVLAEPLGPDPGLLEAAVDRLRDAGGDPAADTVVLAAAGSTDPAAREDLRQAALALADRVGGPTVPVGHIAGGAPAVADVVRAARGDGPDGARVVLATWLLAPGAFHRWLADAGADAVAAPLGEHPGVAAVVARRYRAAVHGAAEPVAVVGPRRPG